ncbi:MAG TPA: hypothetical protein VFQ38_14820 [Longimicrobiales bacterium]|nr:hypothetical protein [Longimicrobiales bacterium]
MPRPPLAALALALVLAACGGATRQAGETSADKAAPRHSRTSLSADELVATNASSAFDAVERLRPEFLRPRGTSSLSTGAPDLPAVFLDGIHAGGLEMLRALRPTEIELIRFVSAADATTRYGTGYPGGVIEVVTKGSKRP